MGAVVAAFELPRLLPECDAQVSEVDAVWVQEWWSKLWPFLSCKGISMDVNQRSGAWSSSMDQVLVVDSLTAEEDTKDNQADDEVERARAEAAWLEEEEEKDAQECWRRVSVSRHRAWEDWTMQAAMDRPQRHRKKQKVQVRVETAEGHLLWTAARRLKMPARAQLQVRFRLKILSMAPPPPRHHLQARTMTPRPTSHCRKRCLQRMQESWRKLQ